MILSFYKSIHIIPHIKHKTTLYYKKIVSAFTKTIQYLL